MFGICLVKGDDFSISSRIVFKIAVSVSKYGTRLFFFP
nr:MAG TPA: hypothetical protein [Caudoviricetes sp.]